MGLSLAEKLIASHLVSGTMKKGEPIGIKIDQTITHDVTGVMVYLEFEAMGLPKVKTELTVSYLDHNMIQADFRNSDDHKFLIDAAAKFGAVCSRPGNGILHQLHLERFAVPGKSMLGADSHTPTAGGLGMLALGSGGLDVAMAMAGEPFVTPMPAIVKVYLTGQLQPFVSAKNVILELLRRVSVKGGIGKVFEYAGPGVETLSVPERAIITDMGAETGATTSLFPSDEIVRCWLMAQERGDQWIPLQADNDAIYDDVINIDLSAIVPLIALPHQPDNVVPVSKIAGKAVDQVLFGSCTNSSLQDILSIAHILKGKNIHQNIDAGINYGSRQVMLESMEQGANTAIARAGVRILENFCGGCNGSGFAPPTGGVSLRTHPRNFLGRSGTAEAEIYLVSPEVAAASALTGVITDPRTLGIEPLMYEMPEKFIINDSMFIMPLQDDNEAAEIENPEVAATTALMGDINDLRPLVNAANAIEIRRGPNIRPLPVFEPMGEVIVGETLIKLGDDITTDHIVPAGANFLPIRSNTPEISKHVFRVVDTSFPARAQEAGGGFIVAGSNYGQGSSREQAALCPRYLGVKAVIAKGFARIHLANLVNFGILPLVFEDEAGYNSIEQGDCLLVAFHSLKAGQMTFVENVTKKTKIPVKSPVSETDIDILKQGGRLNWMKARNKK